MIAIVVGVVVDIVGCSLMVMVGVSLNKLVRGSWIVITGGWFILVSWCFRRVGIGDSSLEIERISIVGMSNVGNSLMHILGICTSGLS